MPSRKFRTNTVENKLFFGGVPTYSPKILIADGAEAITNGFIQIFQECLIRIMCWAHVVRAIDKRLNISGIKDYKDNILIDIYALQLSFSPVYFKYASGLFLQKWRQKNSDHINEFLIYFETEWLNTNSGWYEGICDKTPSQDNGLEANNNVVKTHHTLRRRLPLGHYLGNAVNMVNQWSIDRTKQKIYQHSVHVKIDDWKMAYTWMKENGRILKINDKPHHFIVYKSKYDNLLYQYQHLLLNENLNFTFDEITNVVSHIFYVIINTLNWLYSSCTCCNYFKTYMCIHVMSVAVSCDLVKIPHHCKLMLPVGSKPKRGRIPNALKGLKKQ
jgi:hypothetical protein